MGIDFATAKRWVFTRRRYFYGNAVYFGERFGDDEDRIRSNRERGIRSLLLRRAGGSGVAARLIVEDTTSLQSAGWRERGRLTAGGEPLAFSEARSQLVQWDISIQRAG